MWRFSCSAEGFTILDPDSDSDSDSYYCMLHSTATKANPPGTIHMTMRTDAQVPTIETVELSVQWYLGRK